MYVTPRVLTNPGISKSSRTPRSSNSICGTISGQRKETHGTRRTCLLATRTHQLQLARCRGRKRPSPTLRSFEPNAVKRETETGTDVTRLAVPEKILPLFFFFFALRPTSRSYATPLPINGAIFLITTGNGSVAGAHLGSNYSNFGRS